jgi:hypothetical protein
LNKWKFLLLASSIVLIIFAFAVYAGRIASCYPEENVFAQYSPEQMKGFREACKLDSPLTTQFGDFLGLFIPGIILFSAYWLWIQPRVKNQHNGQLSVFHLLLMGDSLLMMLYGLLSYPVPGIANGPAAWAVEVIAFLGFLCYLATLSHWHWKRWGLILFQGASVALAAFILMGGGSFILAAVIVGGVIFLSLSMRSIRSKLA